MKSTSTIRQLAYDTVNDVLDEYLQTRVKNFRDSLEYSCKAIMDIYGEGLLWRPTYIDVKKLYAYDEGENVLDLVNLSCIYMLFQISNFEVFEILLISYL